MGLPLLIASLFTFVLIGVIRDFRILIRILHGFFTGIYIIGLFYFFDLVKSSSTHGNTIHGWYSKYNLEEKIFAWLWILLIPGIILFISFKLNSLLDKLFKKKH